MMDPLRPKRYMIMSLTYLIRINEIVVFNLIFVLSVEICIQV